MIIIKLNDKWLKTRYVYRRAMRWEVENASTIIVETDYWVVLKGVFTDADRINLWMDNLDSIPYINTAREINDYYTNLNDYYTNQDNG